MLDALLDRFNKLPPKDQIDLTDTVTEETKGMLWIPSPGPQTEAYFCKADVLLYGGCVSGDTEFMTHGGWVRFDKYSPGLKVRQWDFKENRGSFVEPLNYIKYPCNEFIHFYNDLSISMVLSEDHRMPLVWPQTKAIQVKKAIDIESLSKEFYIPHPSDFMPIVLSKKTCKTKRIPAKDGFKYCFTVPTGFLVVRHNGRVFITGNSGGGGKTDLGIGLAVTKHSRSLLMRRKYTDLAFITDRTIEIMGTRKGFNGSAPPRFNIGKGKLIEYGAAQSVGDELSWMGRPHDLLYLDESAHFSETQVRALMGWVRTTEKGQQVRVVLGSNPPLSDEGLWMFKMFAPWLDPAFPEPAKGGELRWCVVNDDDKDIWVDGPGQYNLDGTFVTDDLEIDIDVAVIALSRTFIPAKLSDNPFQNTREYRAQQDGLPKYLRDAIRDGNFLSVRKDHDLQLIPTDWIKAAMDNWKPKPPESVPMCAIAADLTGMGSDTGGGKQDKFVLASRHDGYYNELVITDAQDAKMGKDKAAKIQKHRRDGATIILDMGGGYGDSTYEHLDNNGIPAIKYKGAAKSAARTKASKIPFFNKRAETYYRFMEDLDPGQPGGSKITLPNDPFLTADLCSIRFDKNNSDLNMIKLENKKDLTARLGRSTDYGDPVVMAWTGGGKIASHYHKWNRAHNAPRVVMGKRAKNRRR